jgi:hypothetical protein
MATAQLLESHADLLEVTNAPNCFIQGSNHSGVVISESLALVEIFLVAEGEQLEGRRVRSENAFEKVRPNHVHSQIHRLGPGHLNELQLLI